MKRCPIHSNDDPIQPRCGLELGHRGPHSLLIPTGAVYEPDTSAIDPGNEVSKPKPHTLEWVLDFVRRHPGATTGQGEADLMVAEIDHLRSEISKSANILSALQRIASEHLDLTHYEAGDYVEAECWVAHDSDFNQIAVASTLPNLLITLSTP